MKKEVFYGKIENGEIKIPRSKALKEAMLLFGDQPFQITLERKVKKRSSKQNAYYFGCCLPAVIDALVENGYPRSELNQEVVHEMLKIKFLTVDLVSEQTGEVLTIVKSTTELSTTDFMNFIDDIVRWSANILHYEIKLPNEQAMMNFE